MKIKDIPEFFRPPNYNVTIPWGHIETNLNRYNDRGQLNLDPDFQRGHVWTEDKQIAFVEFCLRGGQSSRDLLFNQKGWMNTFEGEMVLVDGKQRLEAVRRFVRNELPIFGNNRLKDFDKPDVLLRSHYAFFNFKVNNLCTRKEVLEWYLQINTGGVVHTSEEIEKVRALLAKEP